MSKVTNAIMTPMRIWLAWVIRPAGNVKEISISKIDRLFRIPAVGKQNLKPEPGHRRQRYENAEYSAYSQSDGIQGLFLYSGWERFNTCNILFSPIKQIVSYDEESGIPSFNRVKSCLKNTLVYPNSLNHR